MKSTISRKRFLSLAATGAIGCLIAPETALASKMPLSNHNDHEYSSSVLLRYKDERFPALQVCIIDPENANEPTIDPSSVKVINYGATFDKATLTGENFYEICIKETDFDKERLASNQGISLFSSTTNESSDVVASIKVKANWNLSADKKKINLTKVNVTFDQKKGTVTGRGVLIVNDDKKYKNADIGLNFSYSPSWGFRDYHDLDRERNHFVNVWAKATATGMGGAREITCMLIYGS